MWGRGVAKKSGITRRRVAVIGIPAVLGIIAASFAIDAQLSQSANHRDAEQHAAHYAGVGRAQTERRCHALIPIAKRLDCSDAIEQTTREQQRGEYDVESNRNSAVWNEAMGKAAYMGGLIGIMTIILLAYTYEAQLRNILETRRIGEAQTRAYLSVSSCKMMFKDGNPSLQPTIRNSGQSPALEVRWHGVIHFTPEGPEYPVRRGETHPDFRKSTMDIPAQGEREALYNHCWEEDGGETFGLSRAEVQAFLANIAVVVLVTIVVRGKDVFGRAITGTDEFVHIFRKSPPDLTEISLILGNKLNPEEEAAKDA